MKPKRNLGDFHIVTNRSTTIEHRHDDEHLICFAPGRYTFRLEQEIEEIEVPAGEMDFRLVPEKADHQVIIHEGEANCIFSWREPGKRKEYPFRSWS